MGTQFTSVLTTALVTGGSPDVTEPWKIPTGLKLCAGATEPPAQAHGGRPQARAHAARERAGARHGTAVSRVPGGPQTGQSDSPALHVEPKRAGLGSGGGASGGDPKDSHRLAKTLPEVENKPRHSAGAAQPASGEERGLHLEAPPPRGATPLYAQATPTISASRGPSLSCALSPRLPCGWTPHFLSVCQLRIRGLDTFMIRVPDTALCSN